MNDFNIDLCYIDDKEDLLLSKYLYNFSKENKVNYKEYRFLPDTDDYRTLLENSKVNNSDIIVIDSKLFENMNIRGKKLTGEQFKVVLKKEYPYKKTIVISQKDISSSYTTISKYKTYDHSIDFVESKDYYDKNLGGILKEYISEVVEEQKVVEELHDFETIDSVLVSKIQKNIEGLDDNTFLEKNDIDELIDLFKEVKNKYE